MHYNIKRHKNQCYRTDFSWSVKSVEAVNSVMCLRERVGLREIRCKSFRNEKLIEHILFVSGYSG